MSNIDSSMQPELRAVLLSEVRSLLPAFLSAASLERDGPVSASAELLGLPESDLRRVLAVHLMLAEPVRSLVRDLPTGMRRPLTSSARPRVTTRALTSGIDWAGTARLRATSSPLGDVWVTRPALRIFDIPENQALAWVLRTIEERGTLAVPTNNEPPGPWGQEIKLMTNVVHRTRRNSWLESVSATWPGDDAYSRMGADRVGFYRNRTTNAARYLRRILLAPTADDIVDALSERFFEPRQDWRLFEIAVLMRLIRALTRIGTRINPTRLFHDTRSRPFAIFRVNPSLDVRVWYQTWPPATRPSELDDAIRHYEMPTGGTRPDIVVELVDTGVSVQAVVLELKASSSGIYLSSGLSQLLSYLRDRPALFGASASGWLVAPGGTGFTTKPPAGRALWVISADAVPNALVELISRRSSDR